MSDAAIRKKCTLSKENYFFFNQIQLLLNKIQHSKKKKKRWNLFYFLSEFNFEGLILFHLQFQGKVPL